MFLISAAILSQHSSWLLPQKPKSFSASKASKPVVLQFNLFFCNVEHNQICNSCIATHFPNNSFKIIVSPAASLSEDLENNSEASDREENTDSAYRTVHPGKGIGRLSSKDEERGSLRTTSPGNHSAHPRVSSGDEAQGNPNDSSEEEAVDKSSNAEVDKDSEDEVSLPKSVKPVATHSRKSLLSTLTRLV